MDRAVRRLARRLDFAALPDEPRGSDGPGRADSGHRGVPRASASGAAATARAAEEALRPLVLELFRRIPMSQATRAAKALAMLAAVTLFGTACGQAPSSTAADAGNGLTISFKTVNEPAQGVNKLEAVVKQNGKPVTDATVAVTFRMPAMPNMNMPAMQSTAP